MSGQYEPEVLKKLQLCELEILKDFITVCKENNLTYFGFGGTGIGALRHGGFIPWDDDIDLAVPRDDYNTAMEIFRRDFADKYTVVNAQNYNDFPVMNTHIIINDSKFVTKEELGAKYPKGIFLDIFPVDNVPDDPKERDKHLKKTWILSKIFIMKHIPFPHVPFKGATAKLAHCVTAMIWLFLNVFCVSHKFLYKLCFNQCVKYNNTDTNYYAYCCGSKLCGNVFDKKQLYPLKDIDFENIPISFPNNLDDILTAEYGNFMQIPPPEKQKNHRPEILVFPNEQNK
ncbi:MAG: LicD family protein [Clostridia bacterium]|nr:LicD family protein [Clostridia bacterium]